MISYKPNDHDNSFVRLLLFSTCHLFLPLIFILWRYFCLNVYLFVVVVVVVVSMLLISNKKKFNKNFVKSSLNSEIAFFVKRNVCVCFFFSGGKTIYWKPYYKSHAKSSATNYGDCCSSDNTKFSCSLLIRYWPEIGSGIMFLLVEILITGRFEVQRYKNISSCTHREVGERKRVGERER